MKKKMNNNKMRNDGQENRWIEKVVNNRFIRQKFTDIKSIVEGHQSGLDVMIRTVHSNRLSNNFTLFQEHKEWLFQDFHQQISVHSNKSDPKDWS